MIKVISTLTALLLSIVVHAGEDRINLTVDPLGTPVRAIELEGFKTVGEAAAYMVGRVGYSLVTTPPGPIDAPFIVELPIRPSAIVDEIKPLDQVLVSMVGNQYLLYVDRVHRKVSFGSSVERDFVSAEAVRKIFKGQYIVTDPRL